MSASRYLLAFTFYIISIPLAYFNGIMAYYISISSHNFYLFARFVYRVGLDHGSSGMPLGCRTLSCNYNCRNRISNRTAVSD